jgi:hypothetical protein
MDDGYLYGDEADDFAFEAPAGGRIREVDEAASDSDDGIPDEAEYEARGGVSAADQSFAAWVTGSAKNKTAGDVFRHAAGRAVVLGKTLGWLTGKALFYGLTSSALVVLPVYMCQLSEGRAQGQRQIFDVATGRAEPAAAPEMPGQAQQTITLGGAPPEIQMQ